MIREISMQDRDAFFRMVRAFYRTPAVLHELPDAHICATFDAAMAGSPYVKIYILEHEGQVAGYAQVSLTFSNEAGGLTVWLEELYLDDTFRGRGLGSEVLAFLPKQFPTAKRFRLEVTVENKAAMRLYERHGYKILDYRQMVLDRA